MKKISLRGKLPLLALCIALASYGLFFAFLTYAWHPSEEQMTRSSMQQLLVALYNYKARFSAIPELNMPSMTMALAGWNPSKVELIDIHPLKIRWGLFTRTFQTVDSKMNYLDAWGRPMKLEYDAKRQELMIRSMGDNGKDDNGNGDDISLLTRFP